MKAGLKFNSMIISRIPMYKGKTDIDQDLLEHNYLLLIRFRSLWKGALQNVVDGEERNTSSAVGFNVLAIEMTKHILLPRFEQRLYRYEERLILSRKMIFGNCFALSSFNCRFYCLSNPFLSAFR